MIGRDAIFVSGLVTHRVHATDVYEYLGMPNMDYSVVSEDTLLESIDKMATVKSTVVPIIRVCDYAKADVYIAYSAEVEELLGIPYKAMQHRLDEQEKSISTLCAWKRCVLTMSFWERIKFTFTMGEPLQHLHRSQQES